jgi:hypothetical protein
LRIAAPISNTLPHGGAISNPALYYSRVGMVNLCVITLNGSVGHFALNSRHR